MRRFREQLSLPFLGLLPICLLYVKGGQHIVGPHLIFFKVTIADVSLGPSCLQNLNKVLGLGLLIVRYLFGQMVDYKGEMRRRILG